MSDEEKLAKLLSEFFNYNSYKCLLWMLTKNPNFGNIRPCDLIALRDEAGLKKVLNFAEAAKIESGDKWPSQ